MALPLAPKSSGEQTEATAQTISLAEPIAPGASGRLRWLSTLPTDQVAQAMAIAVALAEARALAADGVREVTLLGQNVNSYGRDLQKAARQQGDDEARLRPLFAELLREVGTVPGIRRVRYTSPHPKDMRPDTFAAMAATPTVCEHLHYPLQSGSDRVLALMHRGYTAERYLEILKHHGFEITDFLGKDAQMFAGYEHGPATAKPKFGRVADDHFSVGDALRRQNGPAGMSITLRLPSRARKRAVIIFDLAFRHEPTSSAELTD